MPEVKNPPDSFVDLVKQRLDYDPITGHFSWKPIPKNRGRGGMRVTTRHGRYLCVRVGEYVARLHRLAWRLHFGVWPAGVIDHINNDGCDNRLCNLRDVTVAENRHNTHRTRSKLGLPVGVFRHRGKFRMRITTEGKTVATGTFNTAEEAGQEYLRWKRAIHPIFTG